MIYFKSFSDNRLLKGKNILSNLHQSPTSRTLLHLFNFYPDESMWMIIDGIIMASRSHQDATVRFLMSKINVSGRHNLLLKVSIITGRKYLVEILLKNDKVLDSGLSTALAYARNGDPSIRKMLEKSFNRRIEI